MKRFIVIEKNVGIQVEVPVKNYKLALHVARDEAFGKLNFNFIDVISDVHNKGKYEDTNIRAYIKEYTD